MGHRILALTVNTALGVAMAMFFLWFAGAGQAFADDLAACSFAPTCQDTTPDYVLMLAVGRYGAISITTQEFEDEASCTNAGNVAQKYLAIDDYIKVGAVCASKESAK